MPNPYRIGDWTIPVQSVHNIRRFLDGLHVTDWQLTCLERQGFLVRAGDRLVLAPTLRAAFEARFPRP